MAAASSNPPSDEVLTLAQVLERCRTWLSQRGVDNPRLDADLLAVHALGLPDRVQLYLQLDKPLAPPERDAIRALAQRRGAREPLAWITGHRGFHALDLVIRPGVLVPRPDTEALVDALLARTTPDEELYLADLGCGSGAIGLAIAVARPAIKVYATDLSTDALACTKDNVAALDLGQRVAVLKGNMLAPIPPSRPIDIVVSNPPYIPSRVLAGLAPEVSVHEPRLALDGGPDGLDSYRRLLPAAAARARVGVAVEIGHDQADAVRALFERAGLQDVQVLKDLGRRDRVVLGTVVGARWPVQPVEATGERHIEPVDGPDPARQPALDEQGQPLPVLDADR
ncbi:MAG: peptide chain release factor N(5)-glutamine methyltransferase [Oligoflexia bacterium]|nr:peptide chain release factor N(5)-glutamine methyltransferase [Oligoflexia bacterium]